MEPLNPILTQRVDPSPAASAIMRTPPSAMPDYAALMSPGQQADAAARREAYDLNAAVARVLATSDGQRLLAWMLSFTLERPTWDHTRPIAEAASHGLFREGQNSIAYAVLEMANRGRQVPPTPPQLEPTHG